MKFSFWLRSSAMLVALVGVAACSVQLVSPYNVELASGLTKLHEDVIKTSADIARNASNPATRSKATVEAYAKTWDDWKARVETMMIISEVSNPGVVSCGDLIKRLQPESKEDLDAAEVAAASSTKVDCQTFLFVRLQRRVFQTEQLQRDACAVSNPAYVKDCVGGFGSPPGFVRFGDNSNAPMVQPLLRTIRALMWVQEAKKPPKN